MIDAHVILSRFNLVLPELRARIGLTDENYLDWCRRRVDLFLTYALPSILGQTDKSFDWIIWFDTVLNAPIDRVLAAVAPYPNIHPAFFDHRLRAHAGFRESVRSEIARLEPEPRLVCTTRFDTDDALHRHFVRVLANHTRRLTSEEIGTGIALNCAFGAQLVDGRFYSYPSDCNPFLTMVEPVTQGLRTAIGFAHFSAREVAPVTQVFHREPLWLQVIHEQNVANEPREGLLELRDDAALRSMFSLARSSTRKGAGGSDPRTAMSRSRDWRRRLPRRRAR